MPKPLTCPTIITKTFYDGNNYSISSRFSKFSFDTKLYFPDTKKIKLVKTLHGKV